MATVYEQGVRIQTRLTALGVLEIILLLPTAKECTRKRKNEYERLIDRAASILNGGEHDDLAEYLPVWLESASGKT